MPERLARCTWPALPDRFAAALREAVAFALREVEPSGIVATGTIVRGNPHASSDLDLYVIHEVATRRRIQRFFGAPEFGAPVPTEIFINPPVAVRRYFAEEHADGAPYTAHMLATGVVVFTAGTVIAELRDEAAAWLARASRLDADAVVRARYGAATRFEDATDVADEDPETATMLQTRAVVAMLELWCHQALGGVPRGKDLLGRVEAHDPALGAAARRVFSNAPFAERRAAAAQVADRTIGVRGFFEWDSGFEPV
jgi:predicted nucleotidyltransferase